MLLRNEHGDWCSCRPTTLTHISWRGCPLHRRRRSSQADPAQAVDAAGPSARRSHRRARKSPKLVRLPDSAIFLVVCCNFGHIQQHPNFATNLHEENQEKNKTKRSLTNSWATEQRDQNDDNFFRTILLYTLYRIASISTCDR